MYFLLLQKLVAFKDKTMHFNIHFGIEENKLKCGYCFKVSILCM